MKISKKLYDYLQGNDLQIIRENLKSEELKKELSNKTVITLSSMALFLSLNESKNIPKEDINLVINHIKDSYAKLSVDINEADKVKNKWDRSNIVGETFIEKILAPIFYAGKREQIKEKVSIKNKFEIESIENEIFRIQEDRKYLKLLFVDSSKIDNPKSYARDIFFKSYELSEDLTEHDMNESMFNTLKKYISSINRMNEINKSFPELNIDINYLNILGEVAVERFKEEHNKIIEKTGFNHVSNRLHEIKKIFELSEDLDPQAEIMPYLKQMIEEIAPENSKEPVFIDKYGSEEYRLQVNEYIAVQQALGLNTKSVNNFFVNMYYVISKGDSASSKKIKEYFSDIKILEDMRGLEIKITGDNTDEQIKVLESFKKVITKVLTSSEIKEITRNELLWIKVKKEEDIANRLTERCIGFVENLNILLANLIDEKGNISSVKERIINKEIANIFEQSKKKNIKSVIPK